MRRKMRKTVYRYLTAFGGGGGHILTACLILFSVCCCCCDVCLPLIGSIENYIFTSATNYLLINDLSFVGVAS